MTAFGAGMPQKVTIAVNPKAKRANITHINLNEMDTIFSPPIRSFFIAFFLLITQYDELRFGSLRDFGYTLKNAKIWLNYQRP